MIKIQDKSKCNGCHACAAICPQNAISMVADEEGFWYPSVEEFLCVNCSLCEKVCPVMKKETETDEQTEAFAAFHRDGAILKNSSSGGVFSALAANVLSAGGVVFGAAFDSDFSVSHQAVTDISTLEKLRGSKYMQSRIGDSYRKAKAYLDEGKTVLFSGTPCQIGGLLSYLKKPYDTLITQDIVCHGVPSPAVWQQYLAKRRREKGDASVCTVSFRDKANGWKRYELSIGFEGGAEYRVPFTNDPMMRTFLRDLSLRPSCYDCAFKSVVRKSDITLADFWGVEKVMPDLDADQGVSLVLLHSEKGKALFHSVEGELTVRPCDLSAALSHNPSAVKAPLRPSKRDAFIRKILKQEKDFDETSERFLRVSVKQKIKKLLSKIKKKIF